MAKRSQSRALRARLEEGVIVQDREIRIGAPVFIPKGVPGKVWNCRFKFLGDRPRTGLTYTARGIWIGLYADEKTALNKGLGG